MSKYKIVPPRPPASKEDVERVIDAMLTSDGEAMTSSLAPLRYERLARAALRAMGYEVKG